MASNNYNNENMGVNVNDDKDDNDAEGALNLIKDAYPHLDMTEHEKKAMLCLLSSGFIRKSDGQEGMIRYHTDRRDFLIDAMNEITEAIKDRKNLVNNTGLPFGYSGGRRRTLRKRTHRSKTRRNRK